MITLKKLLNNKRSSLTDPIFSSAYILKIAATILICLYVWLAFQELMTAQIAGSSAETTLTAVMNTLKSAYLSIDYIFPLLVGGILIISTIFAYKTGSGYLWAILSIIFWGLALLMSSVFVNVYLSISAEFPTIYAQMPIMDLIMRNLHWVVLFWVAILSAVMFRKTNVEDEAGEQQRRFYGK